MGKHSGLPVYTLLGGSAQDDIALYRAISQESPAQMAKKMSGYSAEGYTKFQLKVGGDATEDIERIHATRAILKPSDIFTVVLLTTCSSQFTMTHPVVIRITISIQVYITL